MSIDKGEWTWMEDSRLVSGSMEDMIAAYERNAFTYDGVVWYTHAGKQYNTIYKKISPIHITFLPTIEGILSERDLNSVTVYSGQNNMGKSLLLKFLFKDIGTKAYFISCDRFYHVDKLPMADEFLPHKFHDDFVDQFYTQKKNAEENPFDLAQIITSLSDSQINHLFDLCQEMLGDKFSIKSIKEGYQFSGKYVAMNGVNISFGSTGTRLLMTLLGICLNENFETLLIDEPELGFSPRIQATLARYFLDPRVRKSTFPHLKRIFIATHSHLFLDRTNFQNNFVVSKSDSLIEVKQITSTSEFNNLQFQLLGNELETLFLPSAIVLVEGPSDHTFISKVIQLFIPNKSVSVVNVAGEGRMKSTLNNLDQIFGDIQKNPYHNRLFVVRDSKNSLSTDYLVKQGINRDHVITWNKNGIEYYYPLEIMAEIFSCGSNYRLSESNFHEEVITINGITKRKTELAKLVSERLSATSTLQPEINQFLEIIKQVL